MDEDLQNQEEGEEREGIDTDQNALAYIRARKHVMTLNQARKQELK
jgi:hypothetical protein